jgi:hypothetical protein
MPSIEIKISGIFCKEKLERTNSAPEIPGTVAYNKITSYGKPNKSVLR